MEKMFGAFRTTVSDDGSYEMRFKFKSMADMHEADDEWRRFRETSERMASDRALNQSPEEILEEMATKYGMSPEAKRQLCLLHEAENEMLEGWQPIETAPTGKRVRIGHALDKSSMKLDTICPIYGEFDGSIWGMSALFLIPRRERSPEISETPTHWLPEKTDG